MFKATNVSAIHCCKMVGFSWCYNQLYILSHVSNMFDICSRIYNTKEVYTAMQSVLITVSLGRCDWLVDRV